MPSAVDFRRVKRLACDGLSDYAISRATGIPRATVRSWRLRSDPPRGMALSTGGPWRPPDEPAYAYLLGLYLGDGNLWQTGRSSWRLCLTLDASYPSIVQAAGDAVALTAPGRAVRRNGKGGTAVAVLCSADFWPRAFPQHGPGRKHERPIKLERWQEVITGRHPRALIRGLIHSDGCRTINRFETRLPSGRLASYAYPRYFFTNESADIRAIFCSHCERLGIRWTRSNRRNISVSHRDSVALLDGFVGPKR